MPHVHPHTPHELTEGKEDGKPVSHGERVLELGAVLFFVGISLRLDWRPLRITVLLFASRCC